MTDTGKCPAFGYDCEYVAKVEAQAARLAEADALIELQNQDIERLREALEHIENYYGDGHRITELARAALGEAE